MRKTIPLSGLALNRDLQVLQTLQNQMQICTFAS